MLYIIAILISPLLTFSFTYFLIKDEIKVNRDILKDDSGDLLTGLIVGSILIAGVLIIILAATHGILLHYTDPIDTVIEEIPILISINSDNYVSVVENNGVKRVKISKVYITDRIDDYVVRVTYIYPDWSKNLFLDNDIIEYNYYYSPD